MDRSGPRKFPGGHLTWRGHLTRRPLEPSYARAAWTHFANTILCGILHLKLRWSISPRESLQPLVETCPWFTFDNFAVDVDFQDDGGIDLLIYYAPPRFQIPKDRSAGERSIRQRDRTTEGAW